MSYSLRGLRSVAWGAVIGLAIAGRVCAAEAGDRASTPPGDPTLSPMRQAIERYDTDLGALQRFYGIDISDNRYERLKAFQGQAMHDLETVNFDGLDQGGRIDYLLLRNRIRAELSRLEQLQAKKREAAPLLPFAPPLIQLTEANRKGAPLDSQAAAKTINDAASKVSLTKADLEKQLKAETGSQTNRPTAVVANRAAGQVEELRRSFKRWEEFYTGYDPEFAWWNAEACQRLNKNLEDYASFLKKKLAGYPDEGDDPVIGDPIGRKALIEALEAEFIPYTPEQLIEIANKEFAWCEQEMHRAARDLGFGDDWKKALDHVSGLHVKPGEQPQLIRQLADEATKYVEDRQLVTVPDLCKEIWRMRMMSPEQQKVNPYFTGGEVISVSYPTATMSFEDKLMGMRGNNIHFSRATVHHEVIPGHHLQGYMSERYRTHRGGFGTPFLVEGWALYWEMLLWDLNFPRSAEDRVGMLFWRSHRCARIIFSLKFHLGQMTAQEAIDFLVDKIGHERRNATAEVRRSVSGGYGPLYQAAYMLGGLQLRALHKELVESGKMNDRQFHDAVLRENAIPIEMIRAALTQQALARDSGSTWRFYGPL
jgi:uncharacterized protein (DUF885 family)